MMPFDLYEVANVAFHVVIVSVAVVHMNAMHRKTPLLEVTAWWALGAASFAEAIMDGAAPKLVDTIFTAGVAALVMIHTKPEWRRVLADRRAKPRELA